MNEIDFKSVLMTFITISLALVAVLWSWITISELFGGPHAQFKHAVAVMSLLLIAKWIATTKWKHRCTHDTTCNIA